MKNNLVVVEQYMLRLIASLGLFLCVAMAYASTLPATTASLRYVDMQQATGKALILDTRGRATCIKRSLAGAHCLPATDLLGPHGELPSFADIYWALGTAGLDGSETVLVTGDQPVMRDFVAGLLYVSGQESVEILDTPIKNILRAGTHRAGEGKPRGILRQRIYHAGMRDKFLVLPGELSQAPFRKLHWIPIDAAKYPVSTPSLSKIRRNARHTVSGPAQYLIYARRPKLALALYARLLASRPGQVGQLKLVPVAAKGLRAGKDKPCVVPALALFPIFNANITRGGKSWT